MTNVKRKQQKGTKQKNKNRITEKTHQMNMQTIVNDF